MKQKFCQSCGMPLTDEVLGTNADGTKNEDYCMYCYKDGKFLQDCTMDEMIEHCAQFFAETSAKRLSTHGAQESVTSCRAEEIF